MTITFIGTGSGKASITRHHSSILISASENNLLVDAGDGISRALLKSSIDFNSIDGILFTHLHPDHYTGFAALIVQMKMNKRSTELKVYVHYTLIDVLKNFLLTSYILPERLGFLISYISFKKNEIINFGNEIKFQAFENSHLAELAALNKYSSLSYFAGSFLFFYREKKIFYSSDVGSVEDILIPQALNTNILIIEVTHLTNDEIAKVIKKCQPELVYFTHITDGQEESLTRFQNELMMHSKVRTIISQDGLSFKI